MSKTASTMKDRFEAIEIGDFIYDSDGTDRKGLGKGEVKDFFTGYLGVKFETKLLPIFVSHKTLMSYDREDDENGKVKGAVRCYTEYEYKEGMHLKKQNQIKKVIGSLFDI